MLIKVLRLRYCSAQDDKSPVYAYLKGAWHAPLLYLHFPMRRVDLDRVAFFDFAFDDAQS